MQKENAISFKNVGLLFKYQLRQRWKVLLIWAAVAVGCMLMYLAMFPVIKIMFEDMSGSMDMPGFAESMKAITDPNYYFSSILQVVAMAVLAFAAYSGASIFSSEENRGTTEYLYSLPVNRTEVFTGKVLFNVASLAGVCLATMGVSMLLLAVVGEGVMFGAVAICFLFLFLAALMFSFIGSMLSALTKKSFKSAPVAIGIYFGTYLIGMFSSFGLEQLSFMKYFSPTDFLGSAAVMGSSLGLGTQPLSVAVYIITPILIVVPLILAFMFYRKKDIA